MKGIFLVALLVCPGFAWALDLCLPTANDALLRGRDAEFYQPTVEGTVESGMFGCVRSRGRRFHEGIDIKSLRRDRRGESIDPVHAVSEGTVAFVNTKPGLSNYGRYVVLAHNWDGVEVFTLYAHLREVADGLAVGQPVRKEQVIGVLGRSANTREGISVDRAHLHLEINLMLNPHFRIWYPKRDPKAPPFGNFNGQNLYGVDAAALFKAYATNRKLNFMEYMARQPIGFSLLVPGRPFPWLEQHPEQVVKSANPPLAYEVAVTASGCPVSVRPRPAPEVSEPHRRQLQRGLPALVSVNETEMERMGCRRLVERGNKGWQLSDDGREWVDLLTYRP